jgi:hypothetical protein
MNRPLSVPVGEAESSNTSFVSVSAGAFTTHQTAFVASDPAQANRSRRAIHGHTKRVEDAVYAHLRALRALGKKDVSVHAVSEALGLRDADVLAAFDGLRKRGVKLK